MRTNCNNCADKGCRAIHAETNREGEITLRETLPKHLRGDNLARCKRFKMVEPGRVKLLWIISDESVRNAHAAVWKADTKRALARV